MLSDSKISRSLIWLEKYNLRTGKELKLRKKELPIRIGGKLMSKELSWNSLSFRANVLKKEAIENCLIKRKKLHLKNMSVLFNTNLTLKWKEAN